MMYIRRRTHARARNMAFAYVCMLKQAELCSEKALAAKGCPIIHAHIWVIGSE